MFCATWAWQLATRLVWYMMVTTIQKEIVVAVWHNHCYSWIYTKKWCLMMTLSYILKYSLQMTWLQSWLNSHWKMMSGDDHIIHLHKYGLWMTKSPLWLNLHQNWCIMHMHTYNTRIYQIWLVWSHNRQHHWISIEELVQDIYIHIKRRNYQIWLVWSQNGHHYWIPIKKLVQDIYHMCHIE